MDGLPFLLLLIRLLNGTCYICSLDLPFKEKSSFVDSRVLMNGIRFLTYECGFGHTRSVW